MEVLAGVLKPCGCAGMKAPAGVLKPVGCASMEALAGKRIYKIGLLKRKIGKERNAIFLQKPPKNGGERKKWYANVLQKPTKPRERRRRGWGWGGIRGKKCMQNVLQKPPTSPKNGGGGREKKMYARCIAETAQDRGRRKRKLHAKCFAETAQERGRRKIKAEREEEKGEMQILVCKDAQRATGGERAVQLYVCWHERHCWWHERGTSHCCGP
jgi:hypothetical protein